MMFGYRHKKESDPPRFEFFYEPNRILQEPKLIQGTDLALKWKKDYEVVLNYHYRDSGQYVRIFKLKVGDKSKPIESFNRS